MLIKNRNNLKIKINRFIEILSLDMCISDIYSNKKKEIKLEVFNGL